jgi:hypothetical protein
MASLRCKIHHADTEGRARSVTERRIQRSIQAKTATQRRGRVETLPYGKAALRLMQMKPEYACAISIG